MTMANTMTSTDRIPLMDLVGQHRTLREPILDAVTSALDTAGFIGGPYVSSFEQAFAAACSCMGCVGVANGTDALMLALRVLGVRAGDRVVVPAFTFIATAEAATMLGAKPCLVDVDPDTYTLSPERLHYLERTEAEGIKAVIAVHLYGQPADMDPILAISRRRKWAVVEDCAQAHGALYKDQPVGGLGDLGAFSFYPTKNLGAMGDGGAVVGNNAEWLAQLRRISDHGRITRSDHGEPGLNSRLDAIQAAALGIKLPHLNDWNAARVRVAGWYRERLEGTKGLMLPKVAPDRTHVYHVFALLADDRTRLMQALDSQGIATGIHYTRPIHLQPAYRELGHSVGDFPVSESLSERCMSLPMYPELTEAQVDRVARAIRAHLQAGR